jgi:hypothetical protein
MGGQGSLCQEGGGQGFRPRRVSPEPPEGALELPTPGRTRGHSCFWGLREQGVTGPQTKDPGPLAWAPLNPPGLFHSHLPLLSAAISPFGCRAGRDPALGTAISRFSRAVHGPPTTQTNRRPRLSPHPSHWLRRTLRLRLRSRLDAPAPP